MRKCTASLPYDEPLPRPRVLALLGLGLLVILAFVLVDRPVQGLVGGDHQFTLLPAKTGPQVPNIAIACPNDASGTWSAFDVSFGFTLDSADPVARVSIDYGDGHAFSNTTSDGVFVHRYTRSGTFPVAVTVTTVRGLDATSSCTWHLTMTGA